MVDKLSVIIIQLGMLNALTLCVPLPIRFLCESQFWLITIALVISRSPAISSTSTSRLNFYHHKYYKLCVINNAQTRSIHLTIKSLYLVLASSSRSVGDITVAYTCTTCWVLCLCHTLVISERNGPGVQLRTYDYNKPGSNPVLLY